MNKSILSLIGAVDSLIFLLESDRRSRKKPRAVAARRRLERMRQTLLTEGLRQVKILGNARDTISDVACQLPAHLSGPHCSRDIEWVLRSLSTDFLLDVDPPPLPSSSSSQGPSLVDPSARQLAETLTRALLQSGVIPAVGTGSSRPGRGRKTAKGMGQATMRFPDGKIAGA